MGYEANSTFLLAGQLGSIVRWDCLSHRAGLAAMAVYLPYLLDFTIDLHICFFLCLHIHICIFIFLPL